MRIVKILLGVVVVAVLVPLGWWGYQSYLAPVPATPTPTHDAAAEPAIISAEGRVAPEREARLSFQSGGRVDAVMVAEGDSVKAGEPLVRLDTVERQAAVDQAQAALDAARAQRDLVPDGAEQAQLDLADAQVAQAEAALELARASLDQAELRAPFAGTVAVVDVEVGEVAAPGAPVLVVADLSRWHVDTLDLSEDDVLALQVGQTAEVRVPAAAGRVLTGRIARIDLSASQYQGNVTYTVRVDLDPSDLALSWGMTAFVDVEPGGAGSAALAPTHEATSTGAAPRPTRTTAPTAQPMTDTPVAAAAASSTPTTRPATATRAATSTPTPQIHVVARGENLSRIADQYGVSVNDILQANGLTSTTIVTGQQLIIPTP